MSRRTPIMFLDISKKPGDEDCVRTAEDILAENKRLKAEIERLRQPGNVAAMHEAVQKLMDNLKIHAAMPCETISINHAEIDAMIEDCRAALAKPARNCDVGTPDEQAKRFEQFCGSVDGLCDKCELDRPGVCPTCGVFWSQWTYKVRAEGRE